MQARNKVEQYSMHDRENALKEWLDLILPQKDFTLTLLAGDASFRKYYRIQCQTHSYIVMDAPPGKEDLEPFIYIAETLTRAQVKTPAILAVNKAWGFLLLSDLGDELLLGKLQVENVDGYYKEAIHTLLQIQQCPMNDPAVAFFDKQFMLNEMALCTEWFLKQYLGLTLSDTQVLLIQEAMEWIAVETAKQPVTFIHRDYHSRNLMLLQDSELSLGVIDFQDAMYGPFTYDLVSLLKDCYIAWPRGQVLQWVEFFYQHHALARSYYSLAEFIVAFDLCGLQRHLKVLGIFCRLHLRDNKPGYLKDLPLTLHYVLDCAKRYEQLHPLYHLMKEQVYLP